MTNKKEVFTSEQLMTETGIDEITYIIYFLTLRDLGYVFTRDETKRIIFSKDEVFLFLSVFELQDKVTMSLKDLFAILWHVFIMLKQNISLMPIDLQKKFTFST